MNKQVVQNKEIIGLMKGQIPYTEKTLSRLSDLIKDYPYFQTAQLLHTLNLLHLQDSQFLIDLRKTAIYVQDRRLLFLQMEDGFSVPEQTNASENETLQNESSFELIDNFLSNDDKKPELINNEIESIPLSTDYVSYLLSNDENNKEAPPLQYQETIDKFLERDANSPVKIKIDKTDKQDVELLDPTPETTSEEGFFSETLVKIYIKQKKYSKALEIIHKLNLIYPEKNRYFADQIRFLEKLIINTNKNK